MAETNRAEDTHAQSRKEGGTRPFRNTSRMMEMPLRHFLADAVSLCVGLLTLASLLFISACSQRPAIDPSPTAASSNGSQGSTQVGSGRLVSSLSGHTDWVRSVSFSPDGKLLASGAADSTVKLWEVR